MPDVFISHSKSDQSFVDNVLLPALHAQGISTWYSKKDIHTAEEWDRMIDVNIKGVLYGIAAVLPRMRLQGSGHIINISSIAGLKVFAPNGTVYSATKFAVRALSEGVRSEAGAGIRSTIISPGAVESELKEGSTDPEAIKAVGEFYRTNQIPAASIARAIAYAIEQPSDVDINEIVVRPTSQEF